MSYFPNTRRKVAAGVTAGAVVILGGGAAAWAATSSSGTSGASPLATSPPTTAPSAGSAGAHAHHGARRAGAIFARADHGTVEIKQGTNWVTYTFDKGKVTSASATSITLLRPDGQSTTLAINGATKFSGVSSATAVKTNQDASVISLNGTATRVVQGTGGGHAHPGGAKAPAGGTAPSTTPPTS